MIEPGKHAQKDYPVRQPVLLGLFVGTAVGAGYLLAGVPNVELMTLVIALSGAALGPRLGFVCGALSALVYSLGSPYGLPIPLLLGAQMSGMGFSGIVGWWLVRDRVGAGRPRQGVTASVRAGLGGLLATLVYDVLTTLATLGAFDLDLKVVLLGAIPFAAWHLGVNTALFAGLFTQLSSRLRLLGRSQLKGEGRVLVLLLASVLLTGTAATSQTVDSAAPAGTPSDTLAMDQTPAPLTQAEIDGPRGRLGWKRPLWKPFAVDLMQEMSWRGKWLPVVDGGLGAATVLLGEGGTSPNPLVLVDGIPVGTGHLLTDDPWLVATQSLVFQDQQTGTDGWGGTDGVINLATADIDPGKAISYYRGVKGPHESFQRAVSLLTPRSAWRVGFDFEESLDLEGYNATDDPLYNVDGNFPGHARIRQSRTVISRQLDARNSLQLAYTTARKTKDTLPVWGAEHQETWDSGAAATMISSVGSWDLRSIFFWRARDVDWGNRDTWETPDLSRRKISTGRQGLVLDLIRADSPPVPGTTTGLDVDSPGRGGPGLKLIYTDWDVADSGAAWAPDEAGTGSGQTVRLAGNLAARWIGLTATGGLSGDWNDRQGLAPGGYLALGSNTDSRGWRATVSRGGRAPRSDELLTPLDRHVNGRTLLILPNTDLDYEKTLRAGLELHLRLLGLDLAADGSLRRLTEGITWVADSADADQGRLANVLDMDSARLAASIGRQGRFLGWVRIKLQGTWQSFDEKSARAAFLPPENQLCLELMWENHFFREDGILQVALFSTRRGEMADPWDPTRTEILPETTLHDLVLGFRLVGTHLSLGMRNLTDQRVQQTAGTYSPGRELDLRLNWTFRY